MHLGSGPSWQISTDRGNQAYDWALWVRAAERIHVPAAGLVPGPLAIEPLPEPSTRPGVDLAEGWRHWWEGLARMPRWVMGWFVGKGKSPEKAADDAPAVRERRPRRRRG